MNFRLAAAFLMMASACLRAEDDDKSILFNTFYLDGEKPSYVLIITSDKKFELYGPDNEHTEGTVRASGEHVTFTAGNVKRMFHFDSSGKDVKFGRREGDTPVNGNVLGELPPTKDGVFRTLYVCEANWIKKGRPVFRRDAKQKLSPPDPEVVASKPEAAPEPVRPVVTQPERPAEPAIAPVGSFADLAGTYTLKNAGAKDDLLVIQPEGQFTYTRNDGMKQAGTLLRDDAELTFMGGGLKRLFTMKNTNSGIELTRKDTDVVKPGEVLGSMPPQDRSALTWTRKSGAPAAVAEPAPITRAPAPSPVAESKPAPAPTESKPAPAQAESKAPAAAAGAAVTGLKQMAGSFTHKPSPFISETIVIAEDGTFSYKDSNGASVNGTVKIENGAVIVTSGEVVRNFTAKLDGNALILTRTDADNPKFKNDLASMSPTVLKEAKYEKK